MTSIICPRRGTFPPRPPVLLRFLQHTLNRFLSPEKTAILMTALTGRDPVPRCAYCDLPLSHSTSHDGQVAALVQNGLLRSPETVAAFQRVNRALFLKHIPGVLVSEPEGTGVRVMVAPSAIGSAVDEIDDDEIYGDGNKTTTDSVGGGAIAKHSTTPSRTAAGRAVLTSAAREPSSADESWMYMDTPVALPVSSSDLHVQMSAPHVHAVCLELVAE